MDEPYGAPADAADTLLSFVVPCYNSEAYLARCLTSILEGSGPASDYEILVVDDGSTDGTFDLASEFQRQHPRQIRVIHQENRGHGGAINHALSEARGVYLKVVDSDDWLDGAALSMVRAELRRRHDAGDDVDLLFTNYVYEHISDGTRRVVEYREQFPQGRTFSWAEAGSFPKWKFLMMHSFLCRAQFLRDEQIVLPEHISYDDEVLVYVALPRAKRLAYLDCDLYRYATGRSGQSVGDDALARHADDQVQVCHLRIDQVRIPEDVPDKPLQRYLIQDLGFSMVFASLACTMAGDTARMNAKKNLWKHLRETDPDLWRTVRYGFFGFWCFLPGRLGEKMFLDGYHLASFAFKLN